MFWESGNISKSVEHISQKLIDKNDERFPPFLMQNIPENYTKNRVKENRFFLSEV